MLWTESHDKNVDWNQDASPTNTTSCGNQEAHNGTRESNMIVCAERNQWLVPFGIALESTLDE